MQIYIHRNGEQTGPYALDEVKVHLGSGALQPTDLAWYEGAATWMTLCSVPGVDSSTPAKRAQTNPAIFVWMWVAGMFSLACLVATPLLISSLGPKPFPWRILFGGLFLTLTGISVTTQLLFAARSGPASGFCVYCKMRKPTINAGLNRHIGAIFIFFHKSVNGQLCKQCISEVFWKYTTITILFGWWGALSVILTPIVLINNTIVYARSLLTTRH